MTDPLAAPLRKTTTIEVRYAETDQMGVVHHAAYLVWFELARTALCSETGYHYADIEGTGFLLMVTGARLRYRRGARYGDRVDVTAWIDRLGSRGITFRYEVRRDQDVIASGATEHVWVEAASGRPCRLPGLLREPFRRVAGLHSSIDGRGGSVPTEPAAEPDADGPGGRG